MSPSTLRRDWLGNVRADVLAGIVVALALIPEAIGFSIIAGVDPRVGLYASVAIAMVIAFNGPVQLHNVADGVIAPGSTDAVNGGQLYAYTQDMITEQVATMDVVTYDDSSRQTITLNNGGPTTRITNLADGVAPSDAVNVRQLEASEDSAVARANAYTDLQVANFGDQLESLNYDIRRVGRDAHAGTAAALAAAGMPQAMDAGASMIAGDFGVYRGRVGVAVGGSYRAENGQSVLRLGVTFDSRSKVGANAGVGFQF